MPTAARQTAGTLGRDAVAIGVPRVLHGVTLVVLNLLAARQLSPSEYAAVSIAIGLMLLVDAVAGAAVDVTLVGLPTGARLAGWTPLERTALAAKLGLLALLGVLAALVGAVVPTLGAAVAADPVLSAIVLIGACGLLVQRSAVIHHQLRLDFSAAGRLDVSVVAIRAAMLGAAVSVGDGSAALFVACYGLPPWWTLVSALNGRGARQARHWVDRGALDTLAASVPSRVPTFALSALAGRLDLYLLALRGSATEAGLYAAALAVATIPETLAVYLAPVFTARIVPWVESGGLGRRLRRLTVGLAIAWLPATLVGTVLLRATWDWLLPASYDRSLDAVTILLPGTLLSGVTYLMTMSVLLVYRPRTVFVVELLFVAGMAAALWWQAPRGAVVVAVVTLVLRAARAVALQAAALAASRRLG